jgi:uncharacterized protein YyaL (SSP411 family)
VRVEQTLRAFAVRLEQAGRALPMMAAALSTYLAGPQQIVTVTDGRAAGVTDLERKIASRYLPFATTFVVTPAGQQALSDVLPLVAAMKPVAGVAAAAYVCQNFTCRAPATTAAELDEALRK